MFKQLMWNSSKATEEHRQALVGAGLVFLAVCVFLWRRYRERRCRVTLPASCCSPVRCPGLGVCSGCATCSYRRSPSPCCSTTRCPPRRCPVPDPCIKYSSCCRPSPGCIRLDTCRSKSGPIDKLFCLRDLARRSVRFYMGEPASGKCKKTCRSSDCCYRCGAICDDDDASVPTEGRAFEIDITDGIMSGPTETVIKSD